MDLSEKILMLRKKNNLSQEQLAEKLGVSRQAVSKWESRQATPDIDKIVSISEIFGVSTDYLLKDQSEIKEVKQNEEIGSNSQWNPNQDSYRNTTTSTSAVISLVFGILSLVLTPTPILGVPMAVVGFVSGIIGLREIKRTGKKGKGFAIAGISCSTVTAILTIIFIIIVVFGHNFFEPIDNNWYP